VTTDERLVLLSEVELHAAPDAVEIVLADAAFHEHRRHGAAADAERHRPFGAGRERVLAAEVAVTNESLPIGRAVVGQIDLVEEPSLDVEALDHLAGEDIAGHHLAAVVAGLDAGDALHGPRAPVIFALAGDLGHVGAAQEVPVGVAGVDADQADSWIAPERMSADRGEQAAVEAADRTVGLHAELAADRGRERALAAEDGTVGHRAAEAFGLPVESIDGGLLERWCF